MPGWKKQLVQENLWWIGWDGLRHKSPPWLDMTHRDVLLNRQIPGDRQMPFLFARKFSTELSTPVLDAIDAHVSLRHSSKRRAEKVVHP